MSNKNIDWEPDIRKGLDFANKYSNEQQAAIEKKAKESNLTWVDAAAELFGGINRGFNSGTGGNSGNSGNSGGGY